jgi:hypothetical protein
MTTFFCVMTNATIEELDGPELPLYGRNDVRRVFDNAKDASTWLGRSAPCEQCGKLTIFRGPTMCGDCQDDVAEDAWAAIARLAK